MYLLCMPEHAKSAQNARSTGAAEAGILLQQQDVPKFPI